ncbi:MAG: NAD-binding protein [Bacteroidales bacterium]|nr:NAD-binding protein [Bacteroidales bacterium]
MKKKRILNLFLKAEWFLLIFLALLSLAGGIIGFRIYSQYAGVKFSSWDILYKALQLFTLKFDPNGPHVPTILNWSRILAVFVTFYAVIKATLMLFEDKKKQFMHQFRKDHTIICGIGDKGVRFASTLMKEGKKLVLIEMDEANPKLRLFKKDHHIITGDLNDFSLLEEAGIGRARQLFLVTGSDTLNITLAGQTADFIIKKKVQPKIKCYCHVSNDQLYRLMKPWYLLQQDDLFDFNLFNMRETGTKALLGRHGLTILSQITGKAGNNKILLVGFGAFGQTMFGLLARIFNPANGNDFDITILDADPLKKRIFESEYAVLKDFIQAEFYLADAKLFIHDWDLSGYSSVFICIDDDQTALTILNVLMAKAGMSYMILLVLAHSEEITALLSDIRNSMKSPDTSVEKFGRIYAFNIVSETVDYLFKSAFITGLARAIHLHYMETEYKKLKDYEESLKDLDESADPVLKVELLNGISYVRNNKNLVAWEELGTFFKDSNRKQAEDILIKLGLLGYEIIPGENGDISRIEKDFMNHIDFLAQVEHRRWWLDMIENGWKFGEKKDEKERTNPCMVPWQQLSSHDKNKDIEAVLSIINLLKLKGYTVRLIER